MPVFGNSKLPKRLDPALECFTDDQLRARTDVPVFVTDEEIQRELRQRAENQRIKFDK